MLGEMSVQQFRKWRAYYRVEPFGDEWRQASTIATVIANAIAMSTAAGSGKKVDENELYALSHFVPGWVDPRAVESQKNQDKALDSLVLK